METAKQRKDYIIMFLTGCLMGILCFIAVYGVKILDVRYDAWLLRGDLDLRQHYVGWGHFRNDPWCFPFGLITTLSKPYSMSVIYTDSIPLVAVIAKCFSPILPTTFQYFGLYGCFSFALQGGCAMILLHRLTKQRWLIVLGSFFFILSFPILQRLYYHTALASHWLILLSLIIWLYQKPEDPLWKRCLRWGCMGFLCVGIHSYFLPMSGAIMLAAVIEQIIISRKRRDGERVILKGVAQIASFSGAGLFNMWILGAFYGGASAVGGGIGTFESNLNTFYNPMGHGITGLSLPLYNDFQYEGFGYLGLGMLTMVAALLIGGIGVLVWKRGEQKLSSYLKIHHRQVLLFALFVLFILLSAGPIFTWNSHKLIAVPLPGIIGRIADIFRSNGRMVWVSMYVLMLTALVCADRMMRNAFKVIAVVLALILQLVDLSGEIAHKQEYFNKTQVFAGTFDRPVIEQIVAGKEEFILMDASAEMMMDAGYYAFRHHMSMNRFYYARDIDAQIDAQTELYREELLEGNARDSAVYVFAAEDFVGAAYPDLVFYESGEHVIGVKRK